jgi:hypothetical protein
MPRGSVERWNVIRTGSRFFHVVGVGDRFARCGNRDGDRGFRGRFDRRYGVCGFRDYFARGRLRDAGSCLGTACECHPCSQQRNIYFHEGKIIG